MNDIAKLSTGSIPAAFQSMSNLPDMNAAAKAGISGGFAVVGYKGRNWRLKFGGNDELLMDERNVPLATLDVVIVGISPAISKIFYEKRYTEGDDSAPDCWSVDGITPEVSAPKKQAAACALCPQGAWGSRITEAGKKGKACQDSRRIAVVPADDIENESYGGPMLLRIPPMSLSNLSAYSNEIGRFGAQPFMVRTVLGFDYDVAYPHLTFTAKGFLTDAEAREVAGALEDPRIRRVLSDDDVATRAPTLQGASASALAGGTPPAALAHHNDAAMAAEVARAEAAALAQAQAQAQAEAQRVALEQAQALAQAQAQAAAQAQAQAQAPAAAPAGKGGFGKKKASPAAEPVVATQHASMPAPAAAPASAAAPAAAAPAAAHPTVVKQAPDDMEAAIDMLLA